MMPTNEELRDAAISHQIGVSRYASGLVRKILELLRKIEPRIITRLLDEDITLLSRTRQERLLRAIRNIIDAGTDDAIEVLQKELVSFSEYEAKFQLSTWDKIVPLKIEYVLPSLSQLVAAVSARPFQGRLMQEWFKQLPDSIFGKLRDAIRMGVVEGRTTPQLVREIRGTARQGYRDGLFEITRRNAEATVRTATAHYASATRQLMYEQNKHLMKGIQWVSTLDSRTSAICRGRDGMVFPVGEGPRPPAHPNCRSTTVPVMKSLKGLESQGTRFARRNMRGEEMDGSVPAGANYSDWLRAQPVGFQEDVLGVAKAKLFRDGRLTLDRFIDETGKEYTLDQLRRREADAFKDAGV